MSHSTANSEGQELYIKTLAIFKKTGLEITLDNFKQAFRFYWGNAKFKEERFKRIIESQNSMKKEIDKQISNVKEEDCVRMRIAITDSYHTISKAAEIAGIDRSMVKRLVENGTLRPLYIRNPYYKSSAPMKLIRMSELNAWIGDNPNAVEASRKKLEASHKARETMLLNRSRKLASFTDRISSVISEIDAVLDKDPVPMLWIMLKLLQVLSKNQQVMREFYAKNLTKIARMTDPGFLSLRTVIDLQEKEVVKLCGVCAMDAETLRMSEDEYVIHFGKCSNCTTEKRFVKSGKHHELIYSHGDISLIFIIGGSLLREIRSFLPHSSIDPGMYLSDTTGNWWDTIPRGAIPYDFMGILDIIADTYARTEGQKTGK
ncbi:MAG: helix-turn-helix domain-containing protein [Thermoplasmata archaeon]